MPTEEGLDHGRAPAGSADPINHPKHYTASTVEPIDVIEAWDLNFAEGCVLKYLCRWRLKNGVEDLKKARWYLDRLITRAETER